METEEEIRERLENVVATKWLSLAMETDEKRKGRLEKMVATPHSSDWPGDRRKKSNKWIGFDLDLIWIEIGV